MKLFFSSLPLLINLAAMSAVYAQCTTGVDTGGGQCIPPEELQGSQQDHSQAQPQRPQVQWADRWGAIATYEPRGILGVSTNMASKWEAEKAALDDCQIKGGGSRCKLDLSYGNQCAALTVSDKGYNTSMGKTTEEASAKGMQTCTASGDPNCHTYYTACSLPVRVQ